MSGDIAAGDRRTAPATLTAPAKLTLSLRITGRRSDGYHLLESEMVALDLADTLEIDPTSTGLTIESGWPARDVVADLGAFGPSPDNLVSRALTATGSSAAVHLVKRIPPGAGLGGGSSDAAAVLRWAGCTDPDVAAGLGADVPFCVAGGRALVSGVGEVVAPLPFERRWFVLLLPPFGVDTAAVYRAFDRRPSSAAAPSGNDLETAALDVEPRLGAWREVLEEATGAKAQLAGSGSTWFVEGRSNALGLGGRTWLELDGVRAPLVATRTVPVPS